jgi:excisionase family DNA binding protein
MQAAKQEESHSENKLHLLTAKEAATLLSLKESMLRSLVFKKQIPVIKIGGCLRFDKFELMKWLNEKRVRAIN